MKKNGYNLIVMRKIPVKTTWSRQIRLIHINLLFLLFQMTQKKSWRNAFVDCFRCNKPSKELTKLTEEELEKRLFYRLREAFFN